MLAMKNERHMVEASVPGLADMARVSLTECEAALKKLERADKWSRNQGHEGRRIEKCDGGWLILNGEHYRQLMSYEERKEYQRLYHREYRKKQKNKVNVDRVITAEELAAHSDVQRSVQTLNEIQGRVEHDLRADG
jgi:hypothetical protein